MFRIFVLPRKWAPSNACAYFESWEVKVITSLGYWSLPKPKIRRSTIVGTRHELLSPPFFIIAYIQLLSSSPTVGWPVIYNVAYLLHARTADQQKPRNTRYITQQETKTCFFCALPSCAVPSRTAIFAVQRCDKYISAAANQHARVRKLCFQCVRQLARGKGRRRHTKTVLPGRHVTCPLCDIPDAKIELDFLCRVNFCPWAI
jgi:hypothetical protein